MRSLAPLGILLGLALATPAIEAQALRTKSPAGAEVYVISPANGATVPATFRVQFGLKGMGVAPAGVDSPNTGHHHLLIDVETLPDMGGPLPADDHIRHFGGGQTETMVTLPPGTHTLQLLLGDKSHIPHDPPVLSAKLTVTVR